MRRVAPQLADTLGHHGLAAEPEAAVTGRTRTTYTFPLTVRGDAGTLLVDGDLESASVDDGSVLRLYLASVDCGAKALFIHAGTVPASAHDYAGDRVAFWDARDVASLIGLTLWNQALGVPLPTLPGALAALGATTVVKAQPVQVVDTVVEPGATAVPDVADAEPDPVLEAPGADEEPVQATPEETVEVDVPEDSDEVATIVLEADDPPASAPEDVVETPAQPYIDLETGVDVVVTNLPTTADDELDAAEPLVATAAPDPAPEPVGEPATGDAPLFQLPPAFRDPGQLALPVPEGSKGLLPARVTLDEAKQAVATRLFGIDEWELILQPVHLFDYAVDVLRSGSLTADTEGGRLQVNGTDRRVTDVDPASFDPPARVFASPDLTVMDKVLRVNPERAEQVARAWLTEQHGKQVQMPMSGADDGYDLTVRRTVGPSGGEIRLIPLGIWHRPFWRLWGSNGHVDLDAVTATVLDEEIKAPNPDFLLVE
jgi:hypothetical protein